MQEVYFSKVGKHEKRRELLNRNQDKTQPEELTQDLESFDRVLGLIEELPTQYLTTSTVLALPINQQYCCLLTNH